MAEPECDYDVYNTPRISAIEFGEYVAEGSSASKDRLLTRVKYVSRAYRARAWFAKKEIVSFLASPKPNLGMIDAAIEQCRDWTGSDEYGKSEDAAVSLACLEAFLGFGNTLPTKRKTFELSSSLPKEIVLNGLPIRLEVSAIIRSAAKGEKDKVGALFLNTRAGQGLGTKEATKEKRRRAGETVALLNLLQTGNCLAGEGTPHAPHCWNIYVRGQKLWQAPTSNQRRIEDMMADAAAIVRHWDEVQPPDDFDPARANFRG